MMMIDNVTVATSISLLNSDAPVPSVSIDYGLIFQPIVDGIMDAIAKMIPIVLPIAGAYLLIDVSIHVFRLVADRRSAAQQEFWDNVGNTGVEDMAFWSTYTDEQLTPFWDELGAAMDDFGGLDEEEG